jgi:hypothetical protein
VAPKLPANCRRRGDQIARDGRAQVASSVPGAAGGAKAARAKLTFRLVVVGRWREVHQPAVGTKRPRAGDPDVLTAVTVVQVRVMVASRVAEVPQRSKTRGGCSDVQH